MKSKNAQRTPPKHLRPETAAWWKQVVPEYDLESHHLRLLTKACEAWDRSDEAREAIAKHGSVLKTDLVRPARDPKSKFSETRDSRLLGWSVNSALMLRSPSSHVLCLCELTANANQKAQPNKRAALSEGACAWLDGRPCGFFKLKSSDDLAALWAEYGDHEVVFWEPGMRVPERAPD